MPPKRHALVALAGGARNCAGSTATDRRTGSACPLGELKPERGCEGWKKGRRHKLRTSKTVRDHIVRLVQDLGIAWTSLYFNPLIYNKSLFKCSLLLIFILML